MLKQIPSSVTVAIEYGSCREIPTRAWPSVFQDLLAVKAALHIY